MTAVTGLGPTARACSLSGTELDLDVGGLGPKPGLELGGGGALLFWLLPMSTEGPPTWVFPGLDVFGS